MSDLTSIAVDGGASQAAQTQAAQSATAAASQAASSGAATAQSFSTLDALRKEDPKLYNMMIQGCMQQFSRDQEWHNQNLKKILRDNQT